MGKNPAPRQKALQYHYVFKFNDGASTGFEIRLDPATLGCVSRPQAEPSEWCRLGFMKCSGCPLDEKQHEYCPVAVNMNGVVEEFKDFSSHENVQVLVFTKQRDYLKSTSLQEGLSSLFGLYMTTSGCPVMAKLKPLVRYHLPFASMDEIVYRVSSMYLLIQYFLQKKGRTPDWSMSRLAEIYRRVQDVNRGIGNRLKEAAKRDASLMALTNLDYAASLVPFVIDETLDEIEKSLDAYMEEER